MLLYRLEIHQGAQGHKKNGCEYYGVWMHCPAVFFRIRQRRYKASRQKSPCRWGQYKIKGKVAEYSADAQGQKYKDGFVAAVSQYYIDGIFQDFYNYEIREYQYCN